MVYDRHEEGDETKSVCNGDKLWDRHDNTIFAPISNSGIEDVTDVVVTACATTPLGIGTMGTG